MYNLYNVTVEEWQALEKIKAKAYEEGRMAGFQAGFAAAQAQPQAKIEAAYAAGVRHGSVVTQPHPYKRTTVTPEEDEHMNDLLTGRVQKNGVGY